MNKKIHQSDLKQVYELLLPARTEWFSLGHALGLSSSTLAGIEENNVFKPDKYLMKMLEIVLHTNTNLTWSGLCEALRTPSVARNDVAEDIEAMIRTKRKSPILRNDGNSEEGLKSESDAYGKTMCCSLSSLSHCVPRGRSTSHING